MVIITTAYSYQLRRQAIRYYQLTEPFLTLGGSLSTANTITPTKHIAELESIRGIAALLVALFHAPGWYPQKQFIPIIANGYLMVDLFFVISGYVIFQAYYQNINTASQFWRFQLLRFGRLYPVHICILAYLLVTTVVPFSQTNWEALLQQLFLLQAIGPWGHPISFNFPAWSISVEFYTYAVFGLIVLYAKQRSMWIFFALATLALWCLNPSADRGLDDMAASYSQLWRCWAGFFIGAIGAYFAQKIRWRWPASSVTVSTILMILFLQFKPNGLYDPLIYFITLFLILSISLSPMGFVKKILLLPILKWLGKISYSLYMVQLIAVGIVWDLFQHNLLYQRSGLKWLESYLHTSFQEPNTPLIIFICYLTYVLVLLILAWLLFALIEKPCRELSRRYLQAPKLITP